MTDIQFAKEHMGEYFQYRDYKVRVIGYDATGVGASVMIDYPEGRGLCFASASDFRHRELCKTGRYYYVKQEDLK